MNRTNFFLSSHFSVAAERIFDSNRKLIMYFWNIWYSIISIYLCNLTIKKFIIRLESLVLFLSRFYRVSWRVNFLNFRQRSQIWAMVKAGLLLLQNLDVRTIKVWKKLFCVLFAKTLCGFGVIYFNLSSLFILIKIFLCIKFFYITHNDLQRRIK